MSFPWATVITGLVGLGGIGGTLWQGKRGREAQTADLRVSLDATAENLKLSIEAENKRAHNAEKRRVYAALLTVITDLTFASTDFRLYRSHGGGDDHEQKQSREQKAREAMYQTANAVRLIAAPNVIAILDVYIALYIKFLTEAYLSPDFDETDPVSMELKSLTEELSTAMRVDLGEQPWPPKDA